jgi:hypothetical protein
VYLYGSELKLAPLCCVLRGERLARLSQGVKLRGWSTQSVDSQVADVAELADALDSKSGIRKDVWVRPPPSAPNPGPTPRPFSAGRDKSSTREQSGELTVS